MSDSSKGKWVRPRIAYPDQIVPGNPLLTAYLQLAEDQRRIKSQNTELIGEFRGIGTQLIADTEQLICTNERIGKRRLLKSLNELLLEYPFVDYFLTDYLSKDKTPVKPWKPYATMKESVTELKAIYLNCIGFLSELLFIYFREKWVEVKDSRTIRMSMLM